MPRRITYLNYILPVFVGLLLLVGWLSARLWKAGAEEQALFRLSVSAPAAQTGMSVSSGAFLQTGTSASSGSFSQRRASVSSGIFRQTGASGLFSAEILKQIDALPGRCRRWALYCADMEIEIDKYHTAAELCGVELDEYPLTIVKSAGEKQTGIRPALIVGERFFEELSDEYGNPLSERQAEILKEQIGSLAVCLTVQGAVDVEKSTAAGGGAEGTLTRNSRKDRPQDAEFLGIAEGDGVYMDADRMSHWFAQMGLPCEIRRVELEIQGEQNAQKAQDSLEKAGFAVSTAS